MLEVLVCPEKKTALHWADRKLIDALNTSILQGHLQNLGGQRVAAPLDQALVNADESLLYPLWEGIPLLLKSEAIDLSVLVRGGECSLNK